MSWASGDTWGISGPKFLLLYGFALIVVIVLVTIARRALLGGGRPSGMVASAALSVDEIAFLSGGAPGLGASALVALREHGEAATLDLRKILAVGNVNRPDASPAQRELHAAMLKAGSVSARRVGLLAGRTQAAAVARRSLGSRGLLTTLSLRNRIRLLSLLYVALLAVGVVRFIDGVQGDKRVTYLALLLVLTLVIWRYSLRVPNVTRAGRAALRDARVESATLRAGSLPGDRALAVALFGIGALWLAEPALATELGFARANAVASGSDNITWNDTSSSCGGGGGCGGGGCGG
jgi:uncharacterized protein (TIGR04222 family)